MRSKHLFARAFAETAILCSDAPMEEPLENIIRRFADAVASPDPQASAERVMAEIVRDPEVVAAAAGRSDCRELRDLVIHKDERLTVLAGAIPAGFSTSPHNHSLWSVVGVASGREDNTFFERDEETGLRKVREVSVVAPGVLANTVDAIHAIANPLDEPLVAIHVYGGNLLEVDRSSWDSQTLEEIPFQWDRMTDG